MSTIRDLIGDYPDLRSMAEDGDLRAAVSAWWNSGVRTGGIADVLLLRACAELGILPEGVDAAEVITRESSRAFEQEWRNRLGRPRQG